MPKLTIEEGGRSTVYEILDETVLIGRREGVGVRLADPEVGPEHCQLRAVPGVGWKLVDLESRSGTKVNGAFVNQHVLREGDVIQVGDARLTFRGAATPPPAAAGPAAPARAPGPVFAPPRPAAPRSAAPRSSPAEERPSRPRRMRRRGSDAPLIIAAVIAGTAVLLVAFLYLGSAWFILPKNKKIYFDMEDLMKEDRYEEALTLSQDADPDGNQEYYNKIVAERDHIKDRISTRAHFTDTRAAAKEYDGIEVWAQNHRSDVAGAVKRWQEFVAKWDGKGGIWVENARVNLRKLLGGAAAAPPPGTGEKSAGLDQDWAIAVATAKRLQKEDRFQDAIDQLFSFWENHELHTGSGHDAWKQKVDDTVQTVKDNADRRWNELDQQAIHYKSTGDDEKALQIYRRVAERFGMEKYQRLATEAKNRLQRD